MAMETLTLPACDALANARPLLQDAYGRILRKLRVSLLDACNFRCFYCMPKDSHFAPPQNYLKASELQSICRDLVEQGIEQIRVTGGEPTLRQDFAEVMLALAELPLQKLGLTSNGFLLGKYLALLKDIQCQYINISLDSLQAEKFNRLTRSNTFSRVYANILKARDMGFQVKVNTVLIGGWNDDELIDFVRFSEREGLEVRFLELMRIGQALHYQDSRFVSAQQAIAQIGQQRCLIPKKMEFDATSFNFITPQGGQLGFIASESQPFCGSCSRLRLSFDGQLRACLMLSQGSSLRQLTAIERRAVVQQVMGLKPIRRLKEVQQGMYQIGG